MPRLDKRKLLPAILILGFLLIWVLMQWPCAIRAITGFPCPGCGLSRAWLAALRLDFLNALRYHPMFWSVPVLFLFCLFDGQLFRRRWLNTVVLSALLYGIVLCYAIRIVVFLRGDLAI